ncbi:MAG TPA: hypothetical protein VK430_04695 [Xanthobacteraceae bacterium]|nr:hypothetical protein [Xanthobacteraceae bacterium]
MGASLLWQAGKPGITRTADWRVFALSFLGMLIGGVVAIYLFVVLVDPYDIVPFSLPIDRRIVSISDRFMYPQIVRSKRFDSLIVGTSTARLLDPELLDKSFHARIANLAMDSATAWEQQAMIDLFLRTLGPPTALIVGLDGVWCAQDADQHRITFRGFPYWLYDDNRWNDYLYLLNYGTLEIAVRLVGYHLGLYPERRRYDGYEVFVPPESQYDAARAHNTIWAGLPSPRPAIDPAPPLSAAERSQLAFPALAWLDAALARLPARTLKILAFMPIHVAAQPVPGTRAAAVEAECKTRIVALGRAHGAKVIDWGFASPLTGNDANYWDRLHYRVPIATQIAEELGAAALAGRESEDGSYRLLVR